eukprot:515086-Amphidinium_carterae.1
MLSSAQASQTSSCHSLLSLRLLLGPPKAWEAGWRHRLPSQPVCANQPAARASSFCYWYFRLVLEEEVLDKIPKAGHLRCQYECSVEDLVRNP